MNEKKKSLFFLLITLFFIGSIIYLNNIFDFDFFEKNNNTDAQNNPSDSTNNKHSDLYIPGVSVEDVILYFNEVNLDAEYNFGGNPQVLQKWGSPIYYILYGNYTDDDLQKIIAFVNWLNTIEGFPGMYETNDLNVANLKIYFCEQDELVSLMGNDYYGADGGVTFWYSDNVIYEAIICYRNDIDQSLRNSVILEEIYNGLGPAQDTELRPDSIIYSYFSQPQELTIIDEVILKILYNPNLKPGMNKEECERVIRQLYY